MRENVRLPKEVKSTVLPNQFIKKHEKNNLSNMNRPSKSHYSNVDNYNIQVTENLKRINDLIKKLI
jgi:hypothetical protein